MLPSYVGITICLLILVHIFITSRLDYRNNVLCGALNTEISKLQNVQNAAARVVKFSSKLSHVVPVLYDPLWTSQPVRFLFIYMYFAWSVPQYISDLISIRNQSVYQVRSNNGWITTRFLSWEDVDIFWRQILLRCCSHTLECVTHFVKTQFKQFLNLKILTQNGHF